MMKKEEMKNEAPYSTSEKVKKKKVLSKGKVAKPVNKVKPPDSKAQKDE